MSTCSRWPSFNTKHWRIRETFPVCTVQIEISFIGFQISNQFEDEVEVGFKSDFFKFIKFVAIFELINYFKPFNSEISIFLFLCKRYVNFGSNH